MTTVPNELKQLIDLFESNLDDYKKGSFNETQTRIQFIDPLFQLLGWDIRNSQGYAEAYKDVVHEDMVRVGNTAKAPDYSFRVGGSRKFFLEAKRPSIDVKVDVAPAYQLRRYGWTASLPLSILTNFAGLAIYDCRVKPSPDDKASVARVEFIRYDEYIDKWDYLRGNFSKEAILKGSFDKYVVGAPKRKGTAEFDEDFLDTIEKWRAQLAANIALRNPDLDVRELNSAVQNTIDRIVFLRIAEDRGIEPVQRLLAIGKSDCYRKLTAIFRLCDDRYNSGLFHFKKEKDFSSPPDEYTLNLKIDDAVIHGIIKGLYPPESAYAFSVIPADILGQVYERFLGKTIVLEGRKATVVEKPEVRKAGGVYYTPSYVVSYIVGSTLKPRLNKKTINQISGRDKRLKNSAPLRIIDPACGSGSFLIVAYQYLLDWHLSQYLDDGAEKYSTGKIPEMIRTDKGGWKLSVAERKRILLTHIFGVDIDAQAVEVTKLSLLLKVLEGENSDDIARQMDLFRARVLPDLGDNIRCGNSLIGTDIHRQKAIPLDDENEIKINPLDWKTFLADITNSAGFDVVIGNPPYILLEDSNRQTTTEAYVQAHYKVAGYKVDTYHLFIEKAVQILKTGGAASYIVPSNFMTNNHATNLRRLLVDEGHLKEIVNFKGSVFKGASVDTCIFHYDSSEKYDEISFISATPSISAFSIANKIEISTKQILSTEGALISARTINDDLVLSSASKKGVALGTIAHVNFGKQLRDRKLFPKEVITIENERDLPAGYACCYTGKDAKRYIAEWSGLACRTSLASRAGGCWDASKQDATNKIVCKQIGIYPTFGIDEHGFQCLNTMFMINLLDSTQSYYVLGLLNSSLLKFIWLKQFYDQRTTFPKIKGTYLKQLPIVKFSSKSAQAREIVKSVGEIVSQMKKLESTRIASDKAHIEQRLVDLQEEIDNQVFELYGMKKAEIAVVKEFLVSQDS
jgi:hypothetical protein